MERMERTCCLCARTAPLYLDRGRFYCLDCIPLDGLNVYQCSIIVRKRARRTIEQSERQRRERFQRRVNG